MVFNLINVVYLILIIRHLQFIKCVKQVSRTSYFKLQSKIVGGYPIKIESFAFAVLFFNAKNLCSGVILNSYSILTAAHCFDVNKDVEEMIIEMSTRYINEENAELHEVHSFAIHEDYNKIIPFYADIALIFVKEPINFGARKKKALLANNDDWMKKTNNDIFAIGWGMTKYGGQISELGLLRTTLQYVARRECEKLHEVKLTDDMFCLYGDGRRDTCKGDSGGGIVWNRTVIGIVSHGEGCAKKDKPSIYISVSFHREWIERTVTEFIKTYCN